MFNLKQFIIRKGKVPCDYRTGQAGNAQDPALWLDKSTAESMAAMWGEGYGIGFVFTREDPYFLLDIDHCIEDGVLSPTAERLLAQFQGAYMEYSQSGKALHVIGRGYVPPHGCKNKLHGLELYTEGRYVALTGDRAIGSSEHDCTGVMPDIVAQYFPPTASSPQGGEWTDAPVPEWNGYTDDDQLIEAAKRSNSAAAAFGGKASFTALWEAEPEVLGAVWPDIHRGRAYDESHADAALAQRLAFWTGKDCERIKRLMFRSGLVREKWGREDYLYRTILNAVSRQVEVYQRPARPAERAEVVMTGGGSRILTGAEQAEYFRGCVYVCRNHGVFISESGAILKPEQFKAMYGGRVFILDALGEKTTRSAWEAFTESQINDPPRAHATIFRPDRPTGEILQSGTETQVNTYVPINTPRRSGDVGPFLTHLAKVLPVERDRQILLSYMAACVQHKGVKFQWTILLQGVEGNGKTLFTRCVSEAIGMQYTHFPRASEISSKFNSWIANKLFIGVEDVYLPDHKREVIEALKPLITNNYVPVEPKGIDQITSYVCANFMLNSNHKDAIQKTRNDRRFCVFYTAQQQAEDLVRDGMGGNYFPDLYDWLRGGGYAIVHDYLANYQIPDELNPATHCHRAPVTSSTDEAITASLGRVEQEVLEAIHEGRPGFRNGWVSSMALSTMLEQRRLDRLMPLNKRRELMYGLGYVLHPGLPEGRVNNAVLPDNGKTRLYIKQGHIYCNLTKAFEIARLYTEAQLAVNNDTTAWGSGNG